MPFQTLFLLAIVAMIGLVALRLVRVHFERSPLPEGRVRWLFILAFLLVPPIALAMLIQPPPKADQLGGVAWVPIYAILLALIAFLMGLASLLVRVIPPGPPRRVLMLALTGSQGDPFDVPFDPPVTAKLAESVAQVDRTNAAFPRGVAFPTQIDRAGFRGDWDALEAATTTLEGQIVDDHKLGLAVASAAKGTAEDARSRLDTLHRLAIDSGQAWAT